MVFDEKTAEGITKGALSWGESKIKQLAKKFQDRKVRFIQDEDTINLVKTQLKRGEWSLCSQYLIDKKKKILVQMGLALRELDNPKDQAALLNLRDKIHRRFGLQGLHIAQFVQSKLLTNSIASLADKANSVSELTDSIEYLLDNIETNVLFVKHYEALEKKLKEIEIRLSANVPRFFIIFASKSATKLGLKIKEELEKETPDDYDLEVIQEKDKLFIFLSRNTIAFSD